MDADSRQLRIARYLASSCAEGPGLRAVVWTQGCALHCRGCAQPDTWPFDGGQVVEVETLARQILSDPELEGVTLLGGEPFLQAGALAALVKPLRTRGLGIFAFTGYELETLRAAGNPDWDALLSQVDLLADGPFVQDLRDLSRPWVGSSNQRFHFLTERYGWLRDRLTGLPNRVELVLHPDGTVESNGMYDMAKLEALLQVQNLTSRGTR